MGTAVPRTELRLKYNSKDITADIAKYLTGFEYNDIIDGKQTDSLTISLEDSQGLWRSGWFPARGATVEAQIISHNQPNGSMLDCGKFEIDNLDFVGPPNTCSIGAVAVGIRSSIRRERTSKAWEETNVRTIAEEVASRHGFELVYDCDKNPKIDRFDQREQTDIELLGTLCDNNGFGLQTTDKTIVIYEQMKYDQRPAAITFTRAADGYKKHRFRVGASDVFTACAVRYFDPKQKIPIMYEYRPTASEWSSELPPSGHTMKLNERCFSQEEAIVRAKAALREKNKREVTATIEYIGRTDIIAGDIAAVKNYGRFDNGRYFIERARHSYRKSGGYTTTVELRGVLGY